jgi:hypothetical protein
MGWAQCVLEQVQLTEEKTEESGWSPPTPPPPTWAGTTVLPLWLEGLLWEWPWVDGGQVLEGKELNPLEAPELGLLGRVSMVEGGTAQEGHSPLLQTRLCLYPGPCNAQG